MLFLKYDNNVLSIFRKKIDFIRFFSKRIVIFNQDKTDNNTITFTRTIMTVFTNRVKNNKNKKETMKPCEIYKITNKDEAFKFIAEQDWDLKKQKRVKKEWNKRSKCVEENKAIVEMIIETETFKDEPNEILYTTKMTKSDLLAQCEAQKISNIQTKTKKQLIDILNGKSNFVITKADAENSANEWFGKEHSIMRDWFIRALLDPLQHRDIGKILSQAAEYYVNRELEKLSGRTIKDVVGEPYDGITDDEKPIVRHQVKFRGTESWHLETTRRNSLKNQDTNSTGHIAYKSDEFDMLVIFIPGHAFSLSKSKIRCIPTSALVNKQKPNQLITNASCLKSIYDNDKKTMEVIVEMYKI